MKRNPAGQPWLDALFAVSGIPAAELRGPSRVRAFTYWRHLLAALMREDGMRRTDIGAALGRSRRTAYYMVDRGQHLIAYSRAAASAAADLRAAKGAADG